LQIVPYQMFATADGFLVLAVGNDRQWQDFCRAVGRADLAAEPRFRANPDRVKHRAELVPLVEAVMRQRTTRQWQELLEEAGVPCAPVWDYAELFRHPQAQARGLRLTITDRDGQPVDLVSPPYHISDPLRPETGPPAHTLPPKLGEHTNAVLREWLGLDEARIEELRQRGVV
jgi:crotonobetainyl-CoA:carnitine CoA-transferase CaiB-like acyl-CoA transferase